MSPEPTTPTREAEINELIFTALGEASMCWNPIPTGVFNSVKAEAIGERLKRALALLAASTGARGAVVEEIAKRHEELCIMYGGEPWDESCVEDGEQAHMDRGRLLALIGAKQP